MMYAFWHFSACVVGFWRPCLVYSQEHVAGCFLLFVLSLQLFWRVRSKCLYKITFDHVISYHFCWQWLQQSVWLALLCMSWFEWATLNLWVKSFDWRVIWQLFRSVVFLGILNLWFSLCMGHLMCLLFYVLWSCVIFCSWLVCWFILSRFCIGLYGRVVCNWTFSWAIMYFVGQQQITFRPVVLLHVISPVK
jgi:hypothetical protein